MSDYITEIKTAHTKRTMSLKPLPSSASSKLSYQALADHNPFYWQPTSPFLEQSRTSDTASEADTPAATAVTLNSLQVNELQADCAFAPGPDLVLRATFSEVQGVRGAASALIQVAGTELYSVKLGQRLVINTNEEAVRQQGAADLSEDLGKVTVITAQTVTLIPNVVSDPGCAIEPLMILSLYE